MRQESPTQILAKMYCEVFLGRPLNFAVDGRILKRAKDAIKAAESLGGDGQHVWACLLNVASGKTEFTHYLPYAEFAQKYRWPTPLSLDCLFYNPILPSGQKRSDVTLLQAFMEVPPRPPVTDRVAYREWVEYHGRRAMNKNLWNGCYIYEVYKNPQEDPLPPSKIQELLGPLAAQKSVEAWQQERVLRLLT